MYALLYACLMFAQDIQIKKFEPFQKDQTTAMYRNDQNGNPCALLIVQSLKEGLEFEGWVVGDVERKENDYWVFIANGAKHIKVKHADYQTKDVVFADYGTNILQGGQTYTLQLVDDTKDIINKVYSLGWNLNDIEVPRNAKILLKMAATRGDAKAQIAMAQLSTIKNGTSYQNESAYYWVEQLLAKGDSTCLDVMPGELMYVYAIKQENKGRITHAYRYEVKACIKGYKIAGDRLFWIINNGLFVEDCDNIIDICQDSVDVGNIKAMRCLGAIYERGLCENQNLLTAANWYRKAYEASPTNQSKTDLVRVYGNSSFPIDQNSFDFIKQQAAEGLPEAIYQLGYMYDEGRNVPKDKEKAIELYSKLTGLLFNSHHGAAYRLACIYYERNDTKKAEDYLRGLPEDDARYLLAVILFHDERDYKINAFNIFSDLSKKGYQKATDFIIKNY